MVNNVFDVSMFIIFDSGDYVYVNEFDWSDRDKVQFIMLTNDTLNTDYNDDNTIFISKNWKEHVAFKTLPKKMSRVIHEDMKKYHYMFDDNDEVLWWNPVPKTSLDDFKSLEITKKLKDVNTYKLLTKERDFFEARTDFNGYRNTQDIIMKEKTLLSDKINEPYILECTIPAVMVAVHSYEIYCNKKVYGFLPSIGQLATISINIGKLDRFLNMLSFKGEYILPITSENHVDQLGFIWWSSTECNNYQSHRLEFGKISKESKLDTERVLPLFPITL